MMDGKRKKWWVYILLFFVSQLAAVGMTMVLKTTKRTLTEGMEWTLVPALFAANALAIALFFAYRPESITWKGTVQGLCGRKGRRTLLMFLTALPLIALVNIIQEVFFPELPDLVGEENFKAIMHNPLGLLTVAILGPIAEELLFRGGVQTDFSRHHSDQGWFVPIAFSALVFSLVHMNPAQLPIAFILGLVLGFAYWWTGSLAAPICIHVFNNSFACLLSYLSPDDDSIVSFLGGSTGTGVTVIICVFWLYLALRQVHKEGLGSLEKG